MWRTWWHCSMEPLSARTLSRPLQTESYIEEPHVDGKAQRKRRCHVLRGDAFLPVLGGLVLSGLMDLVLPWWGYMVLGALAFTKWEWRVYVPLSGDG